MNKDNATQALIKLVEALNIPVTRKSISDELQRHPDYFSMLAFADVLKNFGVESGVYKVPFDALKEVPTPFISYFRNKQYALVTKCNETEVVLSDNKLHNKKMTTQEFRKYYGGTVLITEDTTQARELDYAQKRRHEILENLRVPVGAAGFFIAVLCLFLFTSDFINTITVWVGLLALLKTAGLVTSVLLLVQSLDASNPLIQKFCGTDSNKNCNAILSSSAAKIGLLSWSEIGFFYFAGTWLVLLLDSNHFAVMQVLAFLNLVSLPYTVYSIYYQWRIAKQWCVFCCIVQALLWLEFFAFLPYIGNFKTLLSSELPGLLFGLTIPVFAWLIAKPYLKQLAQVNGIKEQLRNFKYNRQLFESTLKNQPKYAIPDEGWSIVLGNAEAPNVVIMVSNPYCQPCAATHGQIEQVLNNFDNLQVRIVFAGGDITQQTADTLVHRHLMALNALTDKTIVRTALKEWFSQKQKNYSDWAKKHPVDLDANSPGQLKQQQVWVRIADVATTPSLFLNGYKLPEIYQLKELKYILSEA